MIRGTTPTHVFKTNKDLTGVEVLFITYQQGGVVVEKTIDDVEITEDSVRTTLTQEDTLRFNYIGDVCMQIRARFPDGTAVACKEIYRPVSDILKEGVI